MIFLLPLKIQTNINTNINANTTERDKEHTPKIDNTSRTQYLIVAYMLCSSTMLIVNKGAVYLFPLPSLLLSLQTGFSALVIYTAGKTDYLLVDSLEYNKAKSYILVVCVFIFNIFTNMKALEYSNVETVIVFQTLTSLIIAYGDYKLLKSGMPSQQVMISLGIIVFGAICYVLTDSTFRIEAYKWVLLYFVAKTTEMLYVKHVIATVPMSNWGRSYYNNFLSMFPLFIIAVANGEISKASNLLDEGEISTGALFVVFLSCIVGIGISISGFMCRDAISATSFSVVGNMNKVLTVFINYMIWTQRASAAGLASLLICLVGGAYYAKVR